MTKMWIAITVLCAFLAAQAGLSYGASDGGQQILDPSSAQSVNQVVQWNKNLLVIVRTPGAQPATIHPTHSFAMMHAAIYDAVNAIDGSQKPYLVHLTGISPNASQDAAAAQAAHYVLVSLYPNFQTTLDTELQQSLAQIPDGTQKTDGVNDFNEVKSLGIMNGTTATADQMLTDHFWNGTIQDYWNEIAQTAAIEHKLTTAESARLFALLNLSLADGIIAFYDAKYIYNFWRLR